MAKEESMDGKEEKIYTVEKIQAELGDLVKRREAELEPLHTLRREQLQRVADELAEAGLEWSVGLGALKEKNSAPILPEHVPIFVKAIPRVEGWVADLLVRHLGQVVGEWSGDSLLQTVLALPKEQRESVDYALGLALKFARRVKVDPNLVEQVYLSAGGGGLETLCLAVGRHCSEPVARALLHERFEEKPGHIAEPLSLVGDHSSLQLLSAPAAPRWHSWVQKALDKYRGRLEKRLRNQR